ncbi:MULTISPECIES: NERD domain-containing protein [unclassified Psychrobacter]|uniref:NERD domain-containing protein n=1 Tax=unclassified Psychrobacter TaxID=196806 RepID=UPI003FD45417
MSLMSSFKGVLGETVINVAMWLKLEKDIYHRLNNITLPLANDGSTQIDHIIVSVYGIFVIETKNYKGWIYGREKQRQWTQAFANGRKFKFQNPLRQNYLHIKTLADLLELDMSYFHSMIAFIGECELKTRDELPEHVLTSGMASYVKKKQDKILSEEEVKSIVEQIETNRFNKSWRTNRQHKAYLKNKHSTSKKNNSNTTKESERQLDVKSSSKLTAKKTLKSSEVHQWSGQVEQDDPSRMPFTSENAVFMTPFEVVDDKSESLRAFEQPIAILEDIKKPTILAQTMTCPKCNSEMLKRVAKKGARQGQVFYGCSQFPKCRGVVNIN